ncbi:MAG: radical SAM protein [Bacteroidota bacterium]
MYDRFNRKINYLRISITDRCNLRCEYCMPSLGIKLLKHDEILRFEEIIEFVKVAVSKGIDKIRITGGEPLVRKNMMHFIKEMSQIKSITDLSLTTNGVLLEEFAQPLKNAGLHRVNISLDTVDPDRYTALTRGGDIKKVVRGIVAAKKAGLMPIKINCVVNESSGEADAVGVKAFCETMGFDVRFIHRMRLDTGNFSVVEGGTGGDCSRCNKLRLSSDGKLRPCLFNDIAVNIRKTGYEKAIELAIAQKPEHGTVSKQNKFNEIGG